ncbi:MAG TPA: glycosyltransferase family 2 protein [Melioribacteraceae bacterium]|nr:glycosyltransferase family 2 protein [Melioribacteraceae bacterium]
MEPVPSQIDVSIIIVNYNAFDLLDKCLGSLFNFCKGTVNEIFVVDNNSTSGNIEKLTAKYSGVRLIKNESNIGFAAANNVALPFVKGKYILFLNNDTVFREDSIKTVYDFAESKTVPVFTGIQLLNSDLSKQESVVEFPGLWNTITENLFLYKLFAGKKLFDKYWQNRVTFEEPVEVDVIRGAFMFCPSAKIMEMKGFDERFFFYSEETDLCKRFKDSGGRVFFNPSTSIIHYGGASADSDLWFKFKNQTTGKIQFYQKHFRGANFMVLILFHWIGLVLRGFIFSVVGAVSFNRNTILKGYYFFRQLFVYPVNRSK